MPSKKKKKKGGFRVNRCCFGLTYSNPTTTDGTVGQNPVGSNEALLEFLVDKYGSCDYIIGEEVHKDEGIHFHAYIKYHSNVDSIDCRLFDFNGVHPNLVPGKPGIGWKKYCVKEKKYITNFYEECPYSQALACDTLKEALDHLWKKRPRDMAMSCHNVENNMAKRFAATIVYKLYYGPYPKHFYPPSDWDPTTHSLLLVGPPGIGKTQFARYLLGDCDYVKSKPEQLKKCSMSKPILFDEICMLKMDPEDSKEITDVENGGTVGARYNNIEIPPGLTHVFCSNMLHPFRDPNQAVYGRRVVTHVVEPPPIVQQSPDQFTD